MEKFHAAARMIYLNRTCFNGVYRLNKKGQFNTSFGQYKNPRRICNLDALRCASHVLRNVDILCGDYKDILQILDMQDQQHDCQGYDDDDLEQQVHECLLRFSRL